MTTLPQLSRNGTSTDELLLQQLDVLKAARALRAALLAAHPHMRDYQYRPSEGADAIAESNARIASVDAILDQTLDLAGFLRDQVPAAAIPYVHARIASEI